MQNQLDLVRHSITRWFREHFPNEQGLSFSETILIKNDHYAGHRFYQAEKAIEATWLVDGNTVEIRRAGRIADRLLLGNDEQDNSRGKQAA